MRDVFSTVRSQVGMYWVMEKHNGSWARVCVVAVGFGADVSPPCVHAHVVEFCCDHFVASAVLGSFSMGVYREYDLYSL